jgi:hypothetical protein
VEWLSKGVLHRDALEDAHGNRVVSVYLRTLLDVCRAARGDALVERKELPGF